VASNKKLKPCGLRLDTGRNTSRSVSRAFFIVGLGTVRNLNGVIVVRGGADMDLPFTASGPKFACSMSAPEMAATGGRAKIAAYVPGCNFAKPQSNLGRWDYGYG
jgi:hypothetical protein